MRRTHRRTATRVVGGRVLRKNNWTPASGDFYALDQADVELDRRSPGKNYRHLVSIAQLREFIKLLPQWETVAIGLNAIVLDEGQDCMGWHRYGVVAVCAWERELWWDDCDPGFEREHRSILDLLSVQRGVTDESVEVRWTEEQARAFQLLHILPHELGHHHDRMTTRRQQRTGRGEAYAESYAETVMETVWPRYQQRFDV